MIETLHGCAVAVSEELRLKFGDTVFVEIRLGDGSTVYIVMTGASLSSKHLLRVGNCIKVMKNARKFCWKESGSESDVKTKCDTYFMINAENQIQCECNKLCLSCQSYKLHLNVLQTHLIGISKDMFLPKTTFEREQNSRRELTIDGVFLAQCPKFGHIQFSLPQNEEKNWTTSICIFCPHGKLLINLKLLRIGTLLRVSNVLPVYLWGVLRGFACTVRSSVEVVNSVVEKYTTNLAMTNKPPKCLRSLRSACVMYTVWLVETRRRLTKALVGATKDNVTLDVICDALENVSDRGPPDEASCRNISSPVTSSQLQSSPQSLPVLLSNLSRVQQLLALAPQCIQNEFRDVAYAQLYQIRAGLDADWLGDLLPEVWTCTRLWRAAVDCVRNHILRSGMSQKQVHLTHIEDLCRSRAQRAGLPVLVGSLRSVEMTRTHILGRAVHLSLVDGAGCAVSVVVRAVGVEFHAFLIKQVCGDTSCNSSSGADSLATSSCTSTHEQVMFSFDCRDGASFTVLLPRPSCVLEEHPLHDEQSCGLTVVTCEKDLFIITTTATGKATAERVGWFGSVRCGPTSAVDAAQDDTWRASNGQQVRDLLAADLSVGGAARKCVAFGLVAAKQIILDDFRRGVVSQYPHKAQRGTVLGDRSSLRMKCKLTLRDVRYPDCIEVYMSLTQTAGLVMGSAVQISGCQLSLPESRKKPYLRVDGEAQGASIDVVGFCDTETLRLLCVECNRSSSGRREFARGAGVTSPPPISIAQLTTSSRHNRCLWSVLGQVTFVRRIFVTLRCTLCQNYASASHCAFKCSRCDSVHSIAPLWEAVVAMDDGSGEADVHLEGPDVHRVVRSRLDCSGTDWQKVVNLVERSVRQTGKLVFDPFAARSSAADENRDRDALEDLLWTEDEPHVAVDMRTTDPSSALKAYLRTCSFATHFRMICSVNFYAQQQQQQQQQMSGRPSTRRVNLQEVNRDFPYRAVFTAMPTATAPRLSLEAFGLTELRAEEMRLAAWAFLAQIEENS